MTTTTSAIPERPAANFGPFAPIFGYLATPDSYAILNFFANAEIPVEPQDGWFGMLLKGKSVARAALEASYAHYTANALAGRCRINEVRYQDGERITCMATLSNGEFLVGVEVIDPPKPAFVFSDFLFEEGPPSTVSKLSAPPSVKKYNRDGELVAQFCLHNGHVRKIVGSPNGTRFLSFGKEGDKTAILSAESGEEVGKFSCEKDGTIADMAFSTSGDEVVMVWSNPGQGSCVTRFNAESGKRLGGVVTIKDGINTIKFSSSGKGYLATSHHAIYWVPDFQKLEITTTLSPSFRTFGACTPWLLEETFAIVEVTAGAHNRAGLHYYNFGGALTHSSSRMEMPFHERSIGWGGRVAPLSKRDNFLLLADCRDKGRVRLYDPHKERWECLTPETTEECSQMHLAAFEDGSGFVVAQQGSDRFSLCEFDFDASNTRTTQESKSETKSG